MKKLTAYLSLMGFSILLINNSCDTDCNDCGPLLSRKVIMENTTGSAISLSFYNSGRTSDSIHLMPDVSLTLNYQVSGGPPEGALKGSPYQERYDSVKYWADSRTVTYLKSECNFQSNPLCESDYVTIKDEKGRKGNRSTVKKITVTSL